MGQRFCCELQPGLNGHTWAGMATPRDFPLEMHPPEAPIEALTILIAILSPLSTQNSIPDMKADADLKMKWWSGNLCGWKLAQMWDWLILRTGRCSIPLHYKLWATKISEGNSLYDIIEELSSNPHAAMWARHSHYWTFTSIYNYFKRPKRRPFTWYTSRNSTILPVAKSLPPSRSLEPCW